MPDFFDPVNLWADFDPSLPEPAINLISEYERDGINYSEFYFSPLAPVVSCAAPTRAFGILARHPVTAGLAQTLVFMPGDVDTGIDRPLIAELCGNGYAVLSIDLRGSGEGAARGATFYSASDAAGNFLETELYSAANPKKSCWYIWGAVCQKAVSLAETFENLNPRPLLLAKGLTASAGMILAAADKRFAGAALLFCNERQNFAGGEGEKRWMGGFSAIANAPHVKCPVLFMGAANDDRFTFVNFHEIFARIPPGALMSVSAGLCREIGFAESRNIGLFLSAAACGQTLPGKPAISFSVSENKLYFSVKPDMSAPVSRCVLFYAYGGEARDRNWENKELFISGEGEYTANIDALDIPEHMYIYGAVYYENGLSLCTRLIKKTAAEFGVPAKKITQGHLLYAPGSGRDSFTTVENGRLVHFGDNVEVIKGPLGIEGVRAAFGKLATFKPGDPRFTIPGSAIQINAYSPAPGAAVVILRNGDGVKYYSKEIPLSGGEVWQKIVLSAAMFKTEAMTALQDFSGIKLLYFDKPEGLAVSSILWT